MNGAGVIASLRDIVPIRPLTRLEANMIAERQASLFLRLLDVARSPVNEQLIKDLPHLEVRHLSPWPTSGATQWISGRWVIVLNASEPMVRQRFSLAHEFKHILDHRFAAIIYDQIPADQRAAFIEATCDYFAGCLLMPRPWLKAAWYGGTQRVDLLARRFHVSQAAIATRLAQIGLAEPTPRCEPARPNWIANTFTDSTRPYQRHSWSSSLNDPCLIT